MHMHFDWASVLGGATVLGIVAHAVNTFPQPTSPLGKWALGCIQYAVGQRIQAQNTMSAAPFEKPNDTPAAETGAKP